MQCNLSVLNPLSHCYVHWRYCNMYGNVDYVVPARHGELPLKRSPSEHSNIYLQEESIYEPVRGSEKLDSENRWRLSSTGSSVEETTLHWSREPPQRSCHQRRQVLIAVSAVFILVLILILSVFGYFMSKYSATKMEIASLREEQKNWTILGSFFIFNEEHKKCVEVCSSSSSYLELTASDCSPDSYAQFFRWLPGGRLMSTNEGKCVGVEGKPLSMKPLLLFQCDTEGALSWVCTNETLLGVKGESLYFNYGNSQRKRATLYGGTGTWSRWRAKSLEGKLQDGGACAQSCV
ncbi:uncharacterized protein LOC142151372 isoform X2 [Mixophyes fleayi]|uniref:uncharacterized protein LOC142151372 isoform X2 n=1 Tax=Mixophyes fleayi TaxID=3061075 RepID=UPI003F4E1E0E